MKHVCLVHVFYFSACTPRFVLTARHCVTWDNSYTVVHPSKVQVWLGSHARQGEDGLEVRVVRILYRDDYQQPTCAK